AMLNMAVNVHLVPVTGLTLPMVSMGGSSIWFTSIAIGIVLSVSRYVDEMEGKGASPAKAGRKKPVSRVAASAPEPEEEAELQEAEPEAVPTAPRRSTKKQAALA